MTDLTSIHSYDYALPESLIAQRPHQPRDESRLLVIDRAKGAISHHIFKDLPEFLDSRDLCIANNTQVLKARLLGNRVTETNEPGGKIEMLLLEKTGEREWEGLFKSTARQVPGLRFRAPCSDGSFVMGEIVRGSKDSPNGTIVARFDRDPVESGAGELPLPHYIARHGEAGEGPTKADENAYQTVYASVLGSAAAPTAGLHFTPRVMDALRAKNIGWAELTLHVGLGTFRPVKAENIREHAMHEERYFVSESVAEQVNAHRAGGGRVLAVGTTSVRTLESAFREGKLKAGEGRTDIFIYPGGREFRITDRLLTNFHLPKSTLLMLVCAFAGRELALQAYETAVREKYRFFSYGDAMLIL